MPCPRRPRRAYLGLVAFALMQFNVGVSLVSQSCLVRVMLARHGSLVIVHFGVQLCLWWCCCRHRYRCYCEIGLLVGKDRPLACEQSLFQSNTHT